MNRVRGQVPVADLTIGQAPRALASLKRPMNYALAIFYPLPALVVGCMFAAHGGESALPFLGMVFISGLFTGVHWSRITIVHELISERDEWIATMRAMAARIREYERGAAAEEPPSVGR